MKKAVICLSGHLRSIEKGYNNIIDNIIHPNPEFEFDFIISTWNTREWRSAPDRECPPGTPISDIIGKVFELYKPVEFEAGSELIWDTTQYKKFIKQGDVKKGSNGEHILAMFYKIMRADESRFYHEIIHNKVYDLVIRHRTDIGFKTPIRFSNELVNSMQHNDIFVAKNISDENEWVSDVFAFGSRIAMNRYSTCYTNIPRMVNQHKVFRPEVILYHHLNEMNINIQQLENEWYVIK